MADAVRDSNSPNDPVGEKELWVGRTHFKILFKPAFIQLILLALHYLVAVFIPSTTGWAWWDSWGQFTLQTILVLLSLWYVVVPLLRWRNATFEVTDRRVIKHWGVLNKHTLEIPMERITSFSVERGLIDRIFGCGTLNFQDASAVNYETSGFWNKGKDNKNLNSVRFYDVPKVLTIKTLIDGARYGNRR